jgi:hypothetical protein
MRIVGAHKSSLVTGAHNENPKTCSMIEVLSASARPEAIDIDISHEWIFLELQ